MVKHGCGPRHVLAAAAHATRRGHSPHAASASGLPAGRGRAVGGAGRPRAGAGGGALHYRPWQGAGSCACGRCAALIDEPTRFVARRFIDVMTCGGRPFNRVQHAATTGSRADMPEMQEAAQRLRLQELHKEACSSRFCGCFAATLTLTLTLTLAHTNPDPNPNPNPNAKRP